MPDEETETFQELLERLGMEPESYSGRGMFGARCLSIRTNEPVREALRIGYQAGLAQLEPPKSIRWDQLGTGSVLYWPRVEYKEEE